VLSLAQGKSNSKHMLRVGIKTALQYGNSKAVQHLVQLDWAADVIGDPRDLLITAVQHGRVADLAVMWQALQSYYDTDHHRVSTVQELIQHAVYHKQYDVLQWLLQDSSAKQALVDIMLMGAQRSDSSPLWQQQLQAPLETSGLSSEAAMMRMTAVMARLANISMSLDSFNAQLSWVGVPLPQQRQREKQQQRKLEKQQRQQQQWHKQHKQKQQQQQQQQQQQPWQGHQRRQQQQRSGIVDTLLQTIHMGTFDDIKQLCQQPEAAAVSIGCLDVLLSAAGYWQPAAVDVLAGLPAASKLQAGIVCGWCKPPSKQLNSGLLRNLARRQQRQVSSTAAELHMGSVAEDTAGADRAREQQQPPGFGLLSLPAVQSSISPKGVKSLLKAALRAQTTAWVQQLCQLPAAVRLPPSAAQQLLLLAVQQHASPYAAAATSTASSLRCICQLPSVQGLDSSRVLPAVQAAVQLADSKALSVLVELLPAVQLLEVDDMQQLLLCAVQHKGEPNKTVRSLLVELCKTPASQHLAAGKMRVIPMRVTLNATQSLNVVAC
jgi:hypothetical protein